MLQVQNHTPFRTGLTVNPNPDGIDCVYAVLKATFQIVDSKLEPADDQLPVALTDEYWGDEQTSSIKSPCDMTFMKPGTDVLLIGHAYAPGGSAKQSAVRVRVGNFEKTVWVFGNRIWLPGVTGYSISEPKPFEKIPLRFEYAFGGYDPDPIDPERPDFEPRNPIGRGLAPKRSHKSASSRLLPNLEDPSNLIRSPLDRPSPACFAPVCPHWDPRKSFAGTYDDAWTTERAPFLPLDFDSRFFQSASSDAVVDGYLRGDEPVLIAGATEQAHLRFNLPACSIDFAFNLDGRIIANRPVLDTVIFEPDDMRVIIIWRACQVVDKRLHSMKELVVACDKYAIRSAA